MVLPLAIPGHVMAYAPPGLSGYYGVARYWFGLSLPPLHGLWGAGLALSLYTFPYLFQSWAVLVFACTMSFPVLAFGPIRLALLQIGTRQDEAARAPGASPLRAFTAVAMPRRRSPVVAGALPVFIMVVKEPPITWLLAPTGHTTLSMNVFARIGEGMMREAAPRALSPILFSGLFVGLILKYENRAAPSGSQCGHP